jgi:hypothetical protein
MIITPNHKTYARVEKALAAVPPEAQKVFQAFHEAFGAWCATAMADIQCEAHARGVTYTINRGSKAFVWINFTAKGISLFIPGVKPEDYPGAKPTTTTPDNRPGALINVAPGNPLDTALKAIQDAYRPKGASMTRITDRTPAATV